jgi:hypothetical protein
MNFALRSLVPALLCTLGAGQLSAQGPPLTFERLTCMSFAELEALYRCSAPGKLPCGFARGKSFYNPCEFLPGPRTHVANTLWKGKHFCPEDATLVNQWVGIKCIRANICLGESWLDGRPSHILDYSATSHLWRNARDEMREVCPGLYVGAMYVRGHHGCRLKTLFVLEECGH